MVSAQERAQAARFRARSVCQEAGDDLDASAVHLGNISFGLAELTVMVPPPPEMLFTLFALYASSGPLFWLLRRLRRGRRSGTRAPGQDV